MHSKSIIVVVGVAGLANGAAIERRQLGLSGLSGGGGGGGPFDMVSGLTSGLFGGGGGRGQQGYQNSYTPDGYSAGGGGVGSSLFGGGGSGGGGLNPMNMVSGLTSGIGLKKRDNQAKQGLYDPRFGGPFGPGLNDWDYLDSPYGYRDDWRGNNWGRPGVGSSIGSIVDAFLPGGQFDGGNNFFKREEQAKAEAQDAQDTQDTQDTQADQADQLSRYGGQNDWNDPCTQQCTQYCQQFLFDQVDQCSQQCPQQCRFTNNQGGFGNNFGGPNSLSDPLQGNPQGNSPFGNGNNFVGGPGGPSGWGNGRLRGYGNNNNFPGQDGVLSDPASQAFCNIFDQLAGQPNWSGGQQFGGQQFGGQQFGNNQQCPLLQNQGNNPFQNGGRPFGGGRPGFGGGRPNGFGSPIGGLGPQVQPQGYGNNQNGGGVGFI